MAATDLHRYANARKAYSGQYQGLLDPAIMERKRGMELKLAQEFKGQGPDPWSQISEVQKKLATFEREFLLFERPDALSSELFSIARHLVRLTAEASKPSARPPAGVSRFQPGVAEVPALLTGPYSPRAGAGQAGRVADVPCREPRGRPSGGQAGAGRQAACGPRGRAGRRYQTGRRGQAQTIGRGRRPGDRGLDRSDDGPGPAAGPRSSPAAQRYEDEVEEVERQAYAKIADARFKALGRGVGARRDLHAAAGVRGGERLRRKRRRTEVPHDLRGLSIEPRSRGIASRSYCRPAG